jgi:hypothetical protein
MLKDKLDDVKLELAKEYISQNKTTPALKLIKDLVFEINPLNINEQIEVLSKLLGVNIKRKNYEYFFYRYIKPYLNSDAKTLKNSAIALKREKNRSTGFKTQNNDKKSAVALNPKQKESKNETPELKENKGQALKTLTQTDLNLGNNDLKDLL